MLVPTYQATNSLMELSPSSEATNWQLLKNFPAFYGTRRFITVYTRALHWSLSWARYIQSIASHPISRRPTRLHRFITHKVAIWFHHRKSLKIYNICPGHIPKSWLPALNCNLTDENTLTRRKRFFRRLIYLLWNLKVRYVVHKNLPFFLPWARLIQYTSSHSTSAIEWSNLSVSRPGRFTLKEIATGTYWLGGWVEPRTVLNAVEKRKNFAMKGIEPGPSSPNPSLYLLSYPDSYFFNTYFIIIMPLKKHT
jgi:hypothetical protein